MATSVAECDRIMAASKPGKKVFMISEQSQYWSPVVQAKRLIDSGAIGNVVSVAAKYRDGSAAAGTSPWVKVLDGLGGHGDAKGVAKTADGQAKPWRYDRRLTGGGVAIDGGLYV